MKQVFFAIFGCLVISASLAQGKTINDPNAQVRPAKNFHAIRVSNGIHLYLTQGNEEAVAVSASSLKYRDLIQTVVENGVLRIYIERNGFHWDWRDMKQKAYVSCKVLDGLRGSSGSEVEVDGTIKSGNLDMNFSSGANFRGNVNVTDLKLDQNSGAETNMSGMATHFRVEASSGSSFKGYDLTTEQCDASTSSGASVHVTVNKELSASASSGGQIYYKGTGLIRDISTSSGGEVSRK